MVTRPDRDREARTAERPRPPVRPPAADHGPVGYERLRAAGNRAVAGVLGGAQRAVVQRAHVPIPDAVSEFQRATQPPSGGATADPTVSETGQFYWTQLVTARITAQVAALRPRLAAMPEPALTAASLDWIMTVVNEWGHDRALFWSGEIRKGLALNRKIAPAAGPALDLIAELLAPCPAGGDTEMKQGNAIWTELWGELNRGNTVPPLDRYRNLASLGAVWTWENQACGFTGNVVSGRFQVKRANAGAKRPATAFGATLATSGIRDMRESGGFRRGDILVQSGAAAAAAKMRVALDDGWVVHARVLSGIDYGHGDSVHQSTKGHPVKLGPPPQEHSIMIIGYDGDTFAFWDPDSGSSKTFGPGFGALHLDPGPGRLSTAVSDLDIEVTPDGNHGSGVHRYQVITLGTQ